MVVPAECPPERREGVGEAFADAAGDETLGGMKSPITTHVLDTARGRPAAGVDVVLERQTAEGFDAVGSGTTDDDGRVGDLLPAGQEPAPGVYRITFHVGPYLEASSGAPGAAFFPLVPIHFRVESPQEHYHVPLLLSPYGYSTYRGS